MPLHLEPATLYGLLWPSPSTPLRDDDDREEGEQAGRALPTSGGRVKRVLDMQDGPALLVGHSWGGAVITEAGKDDRVKGLKYVAAAAPDTGQSFSDWWKDYTPTPGAAQILPLGKDGYVALTARGIYDDFAQDLADDERALLLATQGPTGGPCFVVRISTAAWRTKPTWYVVATNDRTLPPDAERDSAKRMNANTLTLASSHVAMISQPAAVADFILEAAATLPTQAAHRTPVV